MLRTAELRGIENANFGEDPFYAFGWSVSTRAKGPTVSGIVARMTDGGFLSTASVVLILACIALLAMLSALTLAPLGRHGRRRYVVAFAVCLARIWAVAVLGIALIRRSI